MRLVRLGEEPSKVGVDVKAALTSFGHGDSVVGGVALLGCTPAGSPRALDAVLVLPRGVLVVVGVDLPEPALRLEAALGAQWRVDDTPLVGGDGAINPGVEAHRSALAVIHQLQAMRAEPLPVTTVIAVGPYIGQVVQPTADLHRGVRVLYPTPTTLLSTARELATRERPCSVEHAWRIISVLSQSPGPPPAELIAEGFADAATADLSRASTTLLPRIVGDPHQANAVNASGTAQTTRRVRANTGTARASRRWYAQPRLLAMGAAGLVVAVMLAGIVVAIASAGGGQSTTKPTSSATPRPPTVTVDGVNFAMMASVRDADCAAHSFGDVRTWLGQRPCRSLFRRVFAAEAAPHKAAVSVATVELPDAAAAGEFQRLVDTSGSGGITDLVQEGQSWSGGPRSFDGAAYVSARNGTRVDIVRVVWIGQSSKPEDPALTLLAQRALRIPTAG